MTNANDPASPLIETVHFKSGDAIGAMHGLTKREYFSAMALQGIMFWDATVNEPHETGKIELLAKQAVGMADALIAELNEEREKES